MALCLRWKAIAKFRFVTLVTICVNLRKEKGSQKKGAALRALVCAGFELHQFTAQHQGA